MKKSTIYRTFSKKTTINVSNFKTIRNYNINIYVVGGSIMRFNRNDENYVYSFVGKNIKKYRKMKGLTQDALAELVNYSPSFIANIESSTHQTFSLGALWRIATALGVSLHELCYDYESLGNDNLKSEKYVCLNCNNELDLPIEIIEVFDFIYSVGKSKELYPTFTCPKCGKKMVPENVNKLKK